MTTIDPKILEKIKKCLALSQSPEPAEAAAALRQAQKLMEKYGVDQATLQLAEIGEATVKSTASTSRVKNWELGLVNLVAKAFGCQQLMWTRGNSYGQGQEIYGCYTFIGLKTQVTIAEYTVQVLLRKLRKARATFVAGLPSHLARPIKTMEADGFCLGWWRPSPRRCMSLLGPRP